MGATIKYRPLNTARVVKGGSTSLWDKVVQLWGDPPTLCEDDLRALLALSTAGYDFDRQFWLELKKLIEQHGAITLSAEF